MNKTYIKNIPCLGLLIGLVALAGCQRRTTVLPEVTKEPAVDSSTARPALPTGQSAVGSDDGASMPMELVESSFRNAYQLDVEKLSYRFKYLNVDQKNDIRFENGRARVNITGLPHSQTGEMILEVFEDGVARLVGNRPNVTLQRGPNNIELVLRPTDAALTTNMTINPPSGEPQQPLTANTSAYFDQHVKGIFLNTCAECHHPGKSLDLTQASMPTTLATNQVATLQLVINTASGQNATMPPAPRSKLSASELEHLQKWLTHLQADD